MLGFAFCNGGDADASIRKLPYKLAIEAGWVALRGLAVAADKICDR